MDEIIKINNLYKSYGEKEVIKGISLDIYQGEVFGFIGKNGVGKSTTIDCMVGIKPFNSGEIFLDGFSIKKDAIKAKKTFGYVNSEPLCYETMTGREYIRFIASIYKIHDKDFEKRLYELNELVNKYAKEANERYVGKTVPVLIEGISGNNKKMVMGYTDTQKLVNVKASKETIGSIVPVKITEARTWSLNGEVVE